MVPGAVGRTGWVFARGKHGTSRCCGKGRDHAGVQEGSTHPKEKRFLNMCLISRVSLRKVFQIPGLIQHDQEGMNFAQVKGCTTGASGIPCVAGQG